MFYTHNYSDGLQEEFLLKQHDIVSRCLGLWVFLFKLWGKLSRKPRQKPPVYTCAIVHTKEKTQDTRLIAAGCYHQDEREGGLGSPAAGRRV